MLCEFYLGSVYCNCNSVLCLFKLIYYSLQLLLEHKMWAFVNKMTKATSQATSLIKIEHLI